MIEELISKVFCTRNCAHLAHWASDSYAEHEALGSFYGDIIDILDNFVEVYRLANRRRRVYRLRPC